MPAKAVGDLSLGRSQRIPVRVLTHMNSIERRKLINAQQLLEVIFTPEARPSLRWLREQTKNANIPYVRIGHLVFFDEEMVRAKLAESNTVLGRRLRTKAVTQQG